MINQDDFSKKIKTAISNLRNLQTLTQNKNPQYIFLDPTINNAITHLVDLDVYLVGKNPYYKGFAEEFLDYRQKGMHRSFFNQLHIDIEDGLREIIDRERFIVKISRKELAEGIVNGIKTKMEDTTGISRELRKIVDLGGNRPSFNDYLNSVLNNTTNLSEDYKKSTRAYMDALNIIRNKVSHPDMLLSEEEKATLIKGKFGNAIASDNTLQMTFEGYEVLLNDVVKFFDTVNSHL